MIIIQCATLIEYNSLFHKSTKILCNIYIFHKTQCTINGKDKTKQNKNNAKMFSCPGRQQDLGG